MTQNSMVGWVKTALLGDLSQYSNSGAQGAINTRPLRDMDRQSNFGRGYVADLAPGPIAMAPRGKKRLSLDRLMRAVRSIGEYDMDRTR